MRNRARTDLIAFDRATTTPNDYNEQIETWAQIGAEWASVNYGRGDERRQAAMEGGVQAATFRVLKNPLTDSITVRDRISFDGSLWDIEGAAPYQRKEIDFTATRNR